MRRSGPVRRFGWAMLALASAWSGSDLHAGGQEAPAHRLELGFVEGTAGTVVSVPLRLSSTEDVQGLVAVVEWDATKAEALEVVVGPSLAEAEVVVARVEAGFLVLGAVLDADGIGNDVIPRGDGTLLGMARLRGFEIADEPIDIPLSFSPDGAGFSAVPGGPNLDNQITIAGRSIERRTGLELSDGRLRILPRPPVAYRMRETGSDPSSGLASIEVVVDHPEDAIEGYEISIAHPAGLRLESVTIEGTDAAAQGADFAEADVLPTGGTLGVVFDLLPPFEGNVLPPGSDHSIARFLYACTASAPGEPSFEIAFQDGLGSPPKENGVVVGGRLVVPELAPGTVTCSTVGGEVCDNGRDDDGDLLVDCNDPDCVASGECEIALQSVVCGSPTLAGDGLPFTPQALPGGSVDVGLFYRSPDVPGPGSEDQVQGLELAMCFPCELQCREELDIRGTIVEAVGAEYIALQCDNDPDDGDGCELILGLLVDALPPFDAATLPPTSVYFRLGTVRFDLDPSTSSCGKCLPLRFCDGINGRGIVPIRNLVSIENFARPLTLIDCEVCVDGPEVFHRGDCNFSGAGVPVTVTDAAALVSYLFLTGPLAFVPPCEDACDANDDGSLGLPDVLFTLEFLFRFGDFPPAPGPGFTRGGEIVPPGVDPTADALGCAGGASCS